MGKWEVVKLGDVCDILDNLRVPITASERKPGPYPYYGANGIQDYVDDYIFDDELVLLAEDGGNFGSKDKPIAYRVSGKCWVNNHAHVLIPKEMLNVDYLCYSIMFYDVSPLISGTTRAKLNQAAVRKMTIPFPPLDIQQKIADILDISSAALEKRRAQIDKLDLLVKSRFIEMFGRAYDIYKLVELPEVCKFIDYRGKTPEKTDNGIPLITAKNVKDNQFSLEPQEYIPKENYESVMTRGIPKINDVLFTTEAPLGNVCRIPPIFDKFSIGQRIITMQPNLNIVTSEYLERALLTQRFQNEMWKRSSGSTVKGIRSKELVKLKIPIPPISRQKQFSDFVQQVETKKALLQNSLNKLKFNHKSLIQKSFKGEIFSE